jgi:hypothetical protein
MTDGPPRVYLSSTFGDLAEHREAVIDSIVRVGAVSVAMEQFGASSAPPLEVCKEYLLDSDVMVLLLGHRYGAVLPGAETSVTEFEYHTARAYAKPVLAFVVDPKYPWPPQFIDGGEAGERLATFKARLLSELVVGYFTSPSDLAVRVVQALHAFRSERAPEPRAASLQKDRTVKQSEDADRDHLIRIEEHLNFLRTSLAEMRDHIDRARSDPAPSAVPSTRPALFLGPSAVSVEEDLCFVAMPYSKEWSKALEDILLDICKGSGMRLLIAKNMEGRFIPHDIWQGITAAAVVIADITDGNPNVAYEIGLADVLGKDVVLLCQGSDVPFDFLGQRLICYENTMKGSIVLREELTARLRRVRERSEIE